MNSRQLYTYVRTGQLDEILTELYPEEKKDAQQARYCDAIEQFESIFGEQEVSIFSSPGRTEIGGNHTDHQGGNVLAAAVNLDILAVVARTDSHTVRIHSQGYPSFEICLDTLDPIPEEAGQTQALVRGEAAGFLKEGFQIGGFDAYITSDVLNGSGLSSSAAFEVLIGRIFSDLFNQPAVDAVTVARIGQYAENTYFGKPCGLMDEMACSHGGLTYMDFYDAASPVIHPVNTRFRQFQHDLCIVNTKGSHAELTADYGAIPAEMRQVAGFFDQELLSRISPEQFYRHLPELSDKVSQRAILRSHHYFQEDQRVKEQVTALEKGEFSSFLSLVRDSGNSSFKWLQNIYSEKDPSCQNLSLALAVSELILKDAGACRVHGGGFAGTIQAFVPKELTASYKKALEDLFGPDTCYILQIRSQGSIKVIG